MAAPPTAPLVAAETDIGLRRRENQDSYGTFQGQGESAGKGYLVVVADGMGGHRGGAVASRLAVETIIEFYRAAPPAPPKTLLEEAFRRASEHIFQKAQQNPSLATMGTTCTALALVNNHAHITHVGDTRAYLIRQEKIEQLTTDQTWVQAMATDGVISATEAAHHPDRNILMQALGTPDPPRSVSLPEPLPVQPDDLFLLCTDGLSGLVEDDELRELARADPDPQQACHRLVELAKARGGDDNITVVLLKIPA
ncbi:MAG: Stp1/IreP family PP2C-type Ser/Thr phosphatase [Terriglobia bacterium]